MEHVLRRLTEQKLTYYLGSQRMTGYLARVEFDEGSGESSAVAVFYSVNHTPSLVPVPDETKMGVTYVRVSAITSVFAGPGTAVSGL